MMLTYRTFLAVATSVGCHPLLVFFKSGNPYSGGISLEEGSMILDELTR